MGCGPSSCSTVAVESVQTEQISVSTATHGWRNHDSRRDVQQRFMHSRRLLALRQTLEAELTQGNLDSLDPRERQMRMDELIARMIFEEELSQMELMRMRVGGMHVWQEAQLPTLNVPNPPKPSPGLTQQEIERVSTRHNFIKNDKLTPGDERTYCYECILCLAEYDDGDPLRVLNCEHIFHVECVDEWLRRNKTCPLCSKSVIATKSNNTLDESNCSISSGSILRQRSQVQSLTSQETESNNQAENVASPSSSLPMESYQSPSSSVNLPSLAIRVAPSTPLEMPSPYLNLPIMQGSPTSSPQLGLPEDRAQTNRSWESDLLSSNATLPGEVPQQPMVVETFNYGNILPPTTNTTHISLLSNNRGINSFDSDDADGLPVPPPYQLSDSPGLPETPATLSSRRDTITT